MPTAIDSESIEFLDDVKKGKPRRFVMICRGASIQRLHVFRKGNSDSILQRLKKEGFKGKAFIGVVDGKGQNIAFKLCMSDGYDAVPGKEAFLKAFLTAEAGIKCHPTYALVPELPQVADADDDAPTTTAAPQVAQAADPDEELRKRMRDRLQQFGPALKEYLASNPDRRSLIQEPLKVAKGYADGVPDVDRSAAAQAFRDLQDLLADTPPATAAVPKVAGTRRGQELWQDAIEEVVTQLDGLSQALADHEVGSYKSLAKKLVSTVRSRFDDRLLAACQAFEVERDPQPVMGVIRQYTELLKNDEIFKMLDENPFEVKLNVRKTLATALAEVEKSVKQAASA